MGRLMGIEPTNAGITIRCVNHFATTAIDNVVVNYMNFEDFSTYKRYYYMVEGADSELPNPKERIYSRARLTTSLPLHIILEN